MSALVILDTEGSGVVSPDREEISRLCKLLHQRLLAAMGPVETRRNVRRSERPNVADDTVGGWQWREMAGDGRMWKEGQGLLLFRGRQREWAE